MHECRHWWKSTQDISSSGDGVIDSGNPSDMGAERRIWVFYKNNICSYPRGHLSSSAKALILTNLVSMSNGEQVSMSNGEQQYKRNMGCSVPQV